MKRRKQQITSYQNVKCDVCEKVFSLKKKEIKYNDVMFNDEKVTVYFFNCKHCKKMYVVKVQDAKLKTLELKLTHSNIMLDAAKKHQKNKEHLNEMQLFNNNCKKEYEEYLKELKASYVSTLEDN